ncbi:NADH-quinone oxidoreductase subunit C [Kineosporia succinea]|uniref:NADH:ubiquinone oxidoreductase subunit C n=1 Tax=Kineosporia succinea TaxID=84632 RepID=A0ABT9P4Z5_9ACTN|nr:NADH-quinone oxidoreductase subunit C [Kineosporia succinea]MDP9827135.1 NADH:ubiquinone oxidoreductase subunit C [Kineosporia succinea]
MTPRLAEGDVLATWFTTALRRAGVGAAPDGATDTDGTTTGGAGALVVGNAEVGSAEASGAEAGGAVAGGAVVGGAEASGAVVGGAEVGGTRAGAPGDGTAPGDSGRPSHLVTVSVDGAGTAVVDVPVEGWLAAAACARDELDLDFLDWLSAVDEPDGDPAGLDVVLHVVGSDSFGAADRQVRRLLLRTRVPDRALTLPSLTGLWPGVAWHERETHEMFGLDFSGFSDGSGSGLRPLLLPDGFEGTPLRKSFVLAARAAKAWPGAKDPGDSGKAPARRKTLPPGVPDPSWGPREPGTQPEAVPERPRRGSRRDPQSRPASDRVAATGGPTPASGTPASGTPAPPPTESDR